MSATFRLFCRIAVAIVTVVVCAGFASPGAGATNLLVAAMSIAVSDGAVAHRASEPVMHWQDGDAPPSVDLKAVESDGDDDDDPRCDVANDPALSFPFVPMPREFRRAWSNELPIDPSRFAAGSGLPRGPPV